MEEESISHGTQIVKMQVDVEGSATHMKTAGGQHSVQRMLENCGALWQLILAGCGSLSSFLGGADALMRDVLGECTLEEIPSLQRLDAAFKRTKGSVGPKEGGEKIRL